MCGSTVRRPVNAVGKPDDRNGRVRFDEGVLETERWAARGGHSPERGETAWPRTPCTPPRQRPTLRVVTCRSRREAEVTLRIAEKILETLGVRVNRQKTQIVHVRHGFAFLGYRIKQGSRALRLPEAKIRSGARSGDLYAYPTQKSVDRFKEAIRRKTRRRIPLSTAELIREINPGIRGWGEYYKRAHVRRLFNRLDRWVVRRLWSHAHKRWRCAGWKTLPTRRLRSELGLVSLVALIPSLTPRPVAASS